MRTVLMVLLLGILSLPHVALAEATCELKPLTLPLFDATPLAILATPQVTPATDVLSEAEAADILEQFVACANTGDPTLVWAMFTPRWFSSEFADSENHYLPAFEFQIANSQEAMGDPLELVSVDEVVVMDDGRVGVTATYASADQMWTDQLILANTDDGWLIDEVVLISPGD